MSSASSPAYNYPNSVPISSNESGEFSFQINRSYNSGSKMIEPAFDRSRQGGDLNMEMESRMSNPRMGINSMPGSHPEMELRDGSIVFVDPKPSGKAPGEYYWYPGVIVPPSEFDYVTVGRPFKMPSQRLVRCFIDNKDLVVTNREILPFDPASPQFKSFQQKFPEFRSDIGVHQAIRFHSSGVVSDNFKWRLWGTSGYYKGSEKTTDAIRKPMIRPSPGMPTMNFTPQSPQQMMMSSHSPRNVARNLNINPPKIHHLPFSPNPSGAPSHPLRYTSVVNSGLNQNDNWRPSTPQHVQEFNVNRGPSIPQLNDANEHSRNVENQIQFANRITVSEPLNISPHQNSRNPRPSGVIPSATSPMQIKSSINSFNESPRIQHESQFSLISTPSAPVKPISPTNRMTNSDEVDYDFVPESHISPEPDFDEKIRNSSPLSSQTDEHLPSNKRSRQVSKLDINKKDDLILENRPRVRNVSQPVKTIEKNSPSKRQRKSNSSIASNSTSHNNQQQRTSQFESGNPVKLYPPTHLVTLDPNSSVQLQLHFEPSPMFDYDQKVLKKAEQRSAIIKQLTEQTRKLQKQYLHMKWTKGMPNSETKSSKDKY
ncbi:hypothetical protein HK096_002987 [Nowakowskiella sp. JEL0078]|nr:hypothetical protein HK096_002987 [Nowakowskiella sp. JEL0078]